MSKITLLAAGAVGYVLGARAGRERYEQLREAYEKVKNDPRVQEKAHQVADAVKEKAPEVAEAVKEKAGQAADAARDRAGSGSGSDQEAGVTELDPDRIRLGDDSGPKGDLP